MGEEEGARERLFRRLRNNQGERPMTTRSKRRAKAQKIQPVPMGDFLSVPINQLVLSPSNVRNIYDPQGIATLADSIARRGLLQSLAIRPATRDDLPAGTYEVIAGGRRFRALESLIADGKVAEDAPVPCVLKTGGDAIDDSLAENTDREALHPLDEFRAFHAMRAAGRADEDIAAAYRVTPAVVRQRLRLANASPVLLAAYEADEIELETLMAYCMVDDHARQERVFASVTGTGNDYPSQIKRLLTETTVPADDKRARFVGIAAYEAAGGAVLRDLFDEEHEGYLQDPELLNQLVDTRLEALRDAELADGWKWAEAALDQDYDARRGLDRIAPVEPTADDELRLAAIEDRIAALRALEDPRDADDEELVGLEAACDADEVFGADDKARAGVFISVDWNGRPSFARGYIRAEDGPREAEETVAPTEQDTEPSAAKKLPDKLVQDLTVFRTAALGEAMANDFGVAFLAVLHALCLAHFYPGNASASALQISARDTYPSAPGLESFGPVQGSEKRRAALKSLLPASADELWPTLVAMDDSTRQQFFAHCAGSTVNAVREPHQPRTSQGAHADTLQDALGLHMVTTGWTATVGSYLGRINKEHILAAVTEARGPDCAAVIASLKKAEMAEEAERLLRGSGWLPPQLRSRAVAESHDVMATTHEDVADEVMACA